MSKQYNIHWRRSDYSKLSHLTRKVNQKIFELQVKRPDIAGYQPAMLDYQDVKKDIKTRRDFNNFINKYNRYLREGVEELQKSNRGAVASKWAVREFEIAQFAENTKRRATAKRLGEQDVTIAGKTTGVKRAEMGSIKENAVKPSKKKFINQSQEEWERASRLFERKMMSTYNDEQMQLMIENYVKGLIAEGYSDDLLQILNKIPVDKFREIIDTDETATYDFIYDPLNLKAKQDSLVELWGQYVDENVDNRINYKGIAEQVALEYQVGNRIKGVGRVRTKIKNSRYKRRK